MNLIRSLNNIIIQPHYQKTHLVTFVAQPWLWKQLFHALLLFFPLFFLFQLAYSFTFNLICFQWILHSHDSIFIRCKKQTLEQLFYPSPSFLPQSCLSIPWVTSPKVPNIPVSCFPFQREFVHEQTNMLFSHIYFSYIWYIIYNNINILLIILCS